ncbi:MAG: YggS family pyridoxal phosphate-dependent enzyme [Prevotella sp.]|nr:YggS family pyridoxal phosphate-dependent enzyme [Prevotella sp.]
MPTISENIQALRAELPGDVALVAVSKFHPAESIMEAYRAGQRAFGESYVKELLIKHEALPKDIAWHFIGHLQTNKVRLIAPFIALIQSVDSQRLIAEIQRCAFKENRHIDVLLELHIAQEATKSGFAPDDCTAFLAAFNKEDYQNVRIRGLMAMASNTDDEAQIAREFGFAADYFDFASKRFFADDSSFDTRSWGMSGDYPIAVGQQANLVRIGTKIFGERHY